MWNPLLVLLFHLCGVHEHHLSWIAFFLVPVEHDNGMSISSGDVVCILPTYVIVGCTPLSRYSVHQGPAIQYILALSSWLNNVFRHLNQSICKCLFVSRPHNISDFEDCWGIAAKFELEDLFQLVIPSSCFDEPLKQQLWIDLYCFIVDFDSWGAECDSFVFFLEAVLQHFLLRHWRQYILRCRR